MHNPDAVFDTLAIVGELEVPMLGVTRLEVQRAAFLACILALYDGRPLADWGYRFARTDYGTPFSAGINDALLMLTDGGQLAEQGGRFTITDRGTVMWDIMGSMTHLTPRLRYLEAAWSSTLLVPPSTLSEGLDNEPTVQRALNRDTGVGLLDGPALLLLYEQFEALTIAVPRQDDDLLAPSVVWLSFMAGQGLSAHEPR